MPVSVSNELQVEVWPCAGAPRSGQEVPVLRSDSVHVWKEFRENQQENLEYRAGLLSPDELARADRFRFAKDHDQFITSRGALRVLLSSYTGSSAEKIQFCYSSRGKPGLICPVGSDLRFNVSHSGDVILLAFTRGCRVGVDVEQIRKDFPVIEVAEQFFSEAERCCLENLPAEGRHEAFFRCWTRKEAYIKATGDGLSLPLDQFDVSLDPNEPAQLLQTRPDPAEAGHWCMRNLDVGGGYAAALVVERKPPSVR